MEDTVRVLLVEDNQFDAELIMQDISGSFKKAEIKWVRTREAYSAALQSFRPDIILSDFMMPEFDGLDALEMAKAYNKRVPFLIITGSLSEEVAAECIKKGAWDYVLKERRGRLIPAMETNLTLKRERLAHDEQQRQAKISQMLFQGVVTLAQDGIVVLDKAGRITMTNPAFEQLTALNTQALKGMLFWEIPRFSSSAEFLKNYCHKLLDGGKHRMINLDIVHPDTSASLLEIQGNLMEYNQQFLGVQLLVRNITERAEMLSEIDVSQDEYAKLFNTIRSGVYVLEIAPGEKDFIITDINKTAEMMDHVKKHEVCGLTISQVYPAIVGMDVMDKLLQVWRDGKTMPPSEVFYHDSRLEGWRSFHAYQTSQRRIVCLVDDVTAEIQAHTRIEKLSKFPDENPSPVLRLDDGGNMLYANSAGRQMLLMISQKENQASQHYWKKMIDIALSEKCRISFELSYSNITMKVMVVPIPTAKYFNIYAMDMTEQKEAEEEVLKLLTSIQQSPVMVAISDISGKVEFANKRFMAVTGYSREEIINADIRDVGIFDEQMEKYAQMKAAVTTGAEWEAELTSRKKNGATFLNRAIVSPVINSAGEISNYVGVMEDITESNRRDMELFKSKEHLKLMNKILRHDLTNHLAAVLSALRIYRKSGMDSYLDRAESIIHRSVNLIRDIRKTEGMLSNGADLQPVNLAHILHTLHNENSDVQVMGNTDIQVLADSTLLSVFDNLIMNSRHHGKASAITVRVEQAGGLCRISVADDGTGIPEKVRESIFEEGFHYGDTGQSGLGLFIVRSVIEGYGGQVWVEDNVPRGVTFMIELRREDMMGDACHD